MNKRNHLLVGAVFFIGLLLAFKMSNNRTIHLSSVQAESATFICTLLPIHWHGDPVYAIENKSDENLSHITIMSWSEQTLPVLWVGKEKETLSKNLRSPVSPPVDLPAHQSVLFVGPRVQGSIKQEFTIDYFVNSHVYSDVVSAPN